jgi:tRNA-specific adenosine deaminase 3
MVKKNKNKVKIDYEQGIIEDRLLQIRNRKISSELSLVGAWSIKIKPQESPKVLGVIREMSSADPIPLQHVKRLQKLDDSELTVILCSTFHIDRDALVSKLEAIGVEYSTLEIRQVPRQCPPTKDLALEWGRLYWPLVWKGNPNDQVLNEMVFNMEHIKQNLQMISEKTNECSTLPIVTAIVDPVDNSLVAMSDDQRDGHPLGHSVMESIQLVSTKEQSRRQGIEPSEYHYLCNDYHVYTTHEPCTMCCMALIHSRVSRLIYLKQCPRTGALNPESGEGYTIHDHKLLNSKFEVFEWIGNEYAVPDIASDINA